MPFGGSAGCRRVTGRSENRYEPQAGHLLSESATSSSASIAAEPAVIELSASGLSVPSPPALPGLKPPAHGLGRNCAWRRDSSQVSPHAVQLRSYVRWRARIRTGSTVREAP